MDKEMLDIVNDLSKKPTTELVLKIMELSGENLILEQQCEKQKEVIDKAIETLEKGITFCENDSQGIYNKCNISINREKKVLDILKEVK